MTPSGATPTTTNTNKARRNAWLFSWSHNAMLQFCLGTIFGLSLALSAASLATLFFVALLPAKDWGAMC